jgi:hypothetical protein
MPQNRRGGKPGMLISRRQGRTTCPIDKAAGRGCPVGGQDAGLVALSDAASAGSG